MLVGSTNYTAREPLVSVELVNATMKNSVSEKQKLIARATDDKLVETYQKPAILAGFLWQKSNKKY
jgi:hypothetical protein